MKILIITGMSGAGKSTVLKFLEDMGYFCVDNLPPSLIPKFIELCVKPGSDMKNIALGIDIRGGKLFNDLFAYLSEIKLYDDYQVDILFLETSDDVLLNRYKESRRNHPLAGRDRLITGIMKERKLLEDVKQKSDYIIDTTYLLTRELREKLGEIFLQNKKFNSLMITVISFGFKYGIPNDSDLVFDVRFIQNPFYIEELKYHTGNDEVVKKFVMERDESVQFLDKLKDMIQFLIPNYINEGKNQLVIGIGCTGGKHRSVTLANELYQNLEKLGHSVTINHRDIEKDRNR